MHSMPKVEEEGIRVYLRIRPPPTSQQSRLLASNNDGVGSSLSTTANGKAGNSGPRLCEYEVEDDFHKSILRLHTTQRLLQEAQRSAGVGSPVTAAATSSSTAAAAAAEPDNVVNNTTVDFQYHFDRVFKPTATQEDVFNTVAKDCVASVLDGLNSTVFAYGQTGSGKTFSITGGTESYQDRGLIPRALAMIYAEVARRRESEEAATSFDITMSYLQIYNDKGQDLLNHGHDARALEELPPVTIHEVEDDVVLKGLEQHSAPTLSDALNLLFLGDTNRLYCETPMNKTSSRSHCIFTVYVEARSATSSTVRRSKLNLVDLAGSERVSKTGVSGTILTEAKHINLSLHFLEQVILALSEKAKGLRDHIPYRNSFLTMVLRDSLGRNCKTAMLATAHVVASQVAETISTCQFAQRVAMIQQAPQVNVETDPALLVKKLKAEVAQLKDEVAYLRANGGSDANGGSAAAAADRVLSDDEKNVCRGMVDVYVQRAAVDGDWDSRLTGFQGDMARMYYCYDVLRERLVKGGGLGGVTLKGDSKTSTATAAAEEQRALLEESEAQVKALRQSLQLKENELQMLLTVLKRAGAHGSGGGGGGFAGARYNALTQTRMQSGSSGDGPDVDSGGNGQPFQFTNDTLSPTSDAELRQRIYGEAQQLIHQLRQTGYARGGQQEGMQRSQQQSPTMSQAAAEAAAQAALTRVTTLAQQGQLTEAEAAAATEFLEGKKGLRLQQQQQQQQEQGSESAEAAAGAASASLDDTRSAVDVLMDEQLVQDRARALEAFKTTYEAQHKVEETKQLLKPKYESCKATAQQLNACVDTIKQLKTKIQRRRAERAADGSDVVDPEEAAWLEELRCTKENYNSYAAQLRQDKEEIDGMHAYLKHAQEQLVRDFERWFSARQQQVQLAVQQQQRHVQQGRNDAKQAGLANELRNVLGGGGGGKQEAVPHEGLVDYVEHNTLSSTNINNNNSNDSTIRSETTGYQVLSAPVPSAASLGRPYPSSAPANSVVSSSFSSSTVHAVAQANAASAAPGSRVGQPWQLSTLGGASSSSSTPDVTGSATAAATVATLSSSMPNASNADLSRFPASARVLSRLASLPTHMPAELPKHDEMMKHSPGPAIGTVSASHSAGLWSLNKPNGWMAAAAAAAAAAAGNGGGVAPGGGASSSPTRPFHLQPLDGSPSNEPQQVSSSASSPSPPPTVAGLSKVSAVQTTTTTPPSTVNGTKVVAGGGVASSSSAPQCNPYFPQFPSTGNAAADEQLAQLYKAREAMRKQLQ